MPPATPAWKLAALEEVRQLVGMLLLLCKDTLENPLCGWIVAGSAGHLGNVDCDTLGHQFLLDHLLQAGGPARDAARRCKSIRRPMREHELLQHFLPRARSSRISRCCASIVPGDSPIPGKRVASQQEW
jgi:hypothetical protein